MSKKKGKEGGKKSGRFGKVVVVMMLLLGVGGAAMWFLMPEQFQARLADLRGMLGL